MNPNLINHIIMGLYAANAVWWVGQHHYPQALYWLGALILTIGITWGMK